MSALLERTMGGQITALIRGRILAGTYPPGSALLQDGLAAEFGVSKIPVREALVQLRAEGLVDIYAHRGFQVRPLSVAEVEEVFRLRLPVEPVGGPRKARNDAEAGDREAAQAALAGSWATRSPEKISAMRGDLNCAFHLSLARSAPATRRDRCPHAPAHQSPRRYIRDPPATRGPHEARHAGAQCALRSLGGRAMRARRGQLTTQHIEETRDELAQFLARD